MQDIFGNPAFTENMMYNPYYIYEGTECEYGKWMLVPQNELPDGATIVPVILASDKAPVTRMSKDCEMHLLFLMIANINSEIHMKATAHTWACIAYTPIPEFLVHPKFHSIPEAHLVIACIAKYIPPLTTTVQSHLMHYSYCQSQFGDAIKHTSCDGQLTLKTLHDICSVTGEHIDPWKIWEFQVVAKKHNLSGVQLPFWQDWRFSNPVIFHVGEILHSCHKWFFDHVLKLCKWVLGDDKWDAHYHCHHKYIGTCHFTGVSHVKQMTGCEHWDIQCMIIATIAGVAGPDFVHAICAIVDYIYHAQAPTFMTSSIQEMETCLEEFHLYKQAILDAGAWRGTTGGIPHFQILKLKLFQSFGSSIWNDPFLCTNWKTGFTQQIMLHLNCEESICWFDLYTLLHHNDTSLGNILSAEHDSMPHALPLTALRMVKVLDPDAVMAPATYNLTKPTGSSLATFE
ncbi:hypothetical protein BKA82DRAFT_4330492 [Pisolithus tinctorius]|nr:hypothetical protein BKA82DRAFT_4330492 [Pisolithus tinctorius]